MLNFSTCFRRLFTQKGIRKELAKSMKRADIQALRGLAVFAVVLFHGFEDYFPAGSLGVDMFFVISGFVVAPLILGIVHPSDPRLQLHLFYTFLRNRFFRLAPALGFTLLIVSILILFFVPFTELSRISWQGIYTIFLVGNFGAYRFAGDYFHPAPNPLIHTWSLAVEEQIYLMIPVIVLLISFCARRFLVSAINSVLITLFAVSLLFYLNPSFLAPLYLIAGLNQPEWAVFYFSVSRLWEFLVGFMLWTKQKQFIKLKTESKRMVCHFRVFFLLSLLFAPIEIPVGILGIFVVLTTALIIFKQDSYQVTPMVLKKAQWLGDRSYSIYLVHLPILYIPLYSPLFPKNFALDLLGVILALILTVALGNLMYHKIESRFRIRAGENIVQTPNLKVKFLQIVSIYMLALVFFSGIILGNRWNFFDVKGDLKQPPYAGFLDPECERDTRDGPPCFYENNAAGKSVLLIGDSHAGHFSQAVVDAAKSAGWNSIIWTHSSCRFELFTQVPQWCSSINNEILSFISKEKPDVVLLSQSLAPGINVRSSIKSLNKLDDVTPYLVVLNQTPIFPDIKFMNAGTLFQKPYNAPKSMRINLLGEDYMKIADKIYNSSSDFKVNLIDLNHNWCQNNICTRWSPEGWLFRDRGHLSPMGANLAVDDLIELLINFDGNR